MANPLMSSDRVAQLAREVATLGIDRPMPPTDAAIGVSRACPDCGYEIGPGFQHSRQPQPDGASHVVCHLSRPLRWASEPPWQQAGELHEDRDCVRCGETIAPNWRHYWPPCRQCRLWSYAGVHILGLLGLNARDWLYWGARPWCGDCGGSGWLPCKLQDLSVLRVSGACQVCDASAFKLVHATAERRGDVEGSARHYGDGTYDHDAVVGATPLVRALGETLERASA